MPTINQETAAMERLIKRYQNRKMYDTSEKTYVNLNDIEAMIRENIEVKIIDNVTGEDITRQVLIQLVMRSEPVENEKKLPLEGLREMIQSKDGPLAQAFRGVLDFGRGIMSPSGESSQQLGNLTEFMNRVTETLSEKTVKIVNGSLAREMLHVPNRADWERIEQKLNRLENMLSEIEINGGSKK
jgi:polyhydroxyalkanoate synthesis repressor PhaR